MTAAIQTSVTAVKRFLAGSAAAAALLAFAPTASAQEGWAVCASEGQVCQVTGDAMVRYGADGKFAFRNTKAPLVCSAESFGVDPVPGRRKVCEVSTSWRGESRYRWWRDAGQQTPTAGRAGEAPVNWRPCAQEGAVCEIGGSARVRFGVPGRYVTALASQRVECSARAFGSDPAPGQRKVCEVEDTGPVWVLCANEGDTCSLPGAAQVRYGANGRYVEKAANGSFGCNNSQFGDPTPGLAKQCEYKVGGGTVAPYNTGVTALAWDTCAQENGQCDFRGAAMVRYGAQGRYVYREVSNGVRCSNEEFGGDPAPATPKQCELLKFKR